MKTKRILSMILVAVLLLSVLPTAALAASIEGLAEGTSLVPSHMTVTQDKASTLAPGVTQHEVALFDKNGDRVEMYVAIADMNVDTVKLFTSYKDMDPTNYGMSKLTEQVASFNEKAASGDPYYQGTVVVGINSSYYNMTTGKPTGTFVMNGIDVTTESEGNKYGYFAVMKDGSVKIGKPGDYSSDEGNIQEAIGIHTMLITDGVMNSNLNDVTKYPRQTIGITADNKVILMTADGNQAPDSIGLTLKEQAEVMEAMGCVWAGHLDGGGSATYVCKPEGSDDLEVTNSPSDGSERSISNGFIIVSTAAASYEFDRVTYDVESEYVTPGTSIEVGTAGVSSSGHSADIPEGLTYEVVNGSFADGVFTAGTAVGEAIITAMYDGKTVGSTAINVVTPTEVSFNSDTMTIPYGKSVDLGLSAKYGAFDVVFKAGDLRITLSAPAIGTISGLVFNAASEPEVTTSTVTATLVADPSVTATATLNLGKGSEVIYDFEDGTTQGVQFSEPAGTKYNYVWPESEQKVVDDTIGKVHSGDYALSMYVNYGNSLESGYMKTSVVAPETKVFENAVRIGAWIYIPDEAVGLWARWTLKAVTSYNDDGTPVWGTAVNGNGMDTTAGGTGVVYTFDEPGWHYLNVDTSAYAAVGWPAGGVMMQFYISDRDGSAYDYVASENSNIPSKFQFYMDDITVDYSSAVDDREAPVFSNVTYAIEGMADAAALDGQTVTANKVTFAANVADYVKSNATGIDASSVAVYIDGVKVESIYAGNIVSVADVELTNGKHTIKFAAYDNMGNYGYAYQYITVNAETSADTVYLAPHDATLDRILLDSIYWMDLVATAIEEVESVQVVIDLDNNSTWQLDHMITAAGFEAEYTVDAAENIATITITKTGENDQTGEAVLVTMPVRVWTLKTGYVYPNGTKQGQNAMTLKQFRDGKEFWRMSVIANVDMGVLTGVDGVTTTFTGERVFCDTEMWGNYAAMSATEQGLAYYNAWDGGHIHTAEAVADKAATCTEAGYTGRTYCAVCDSVVDWGTTIPATGHTYVVTEGVLGCACGEDFNGVYTDGKTYIDGVVAAGWVEDSYYVDGIALTGVQKIDGVYYDFGEDGICANQTKFTGLFYNTELGAYSYSKMGALSTGWINHEGNWHFFHGNGKAASGHYEGYFFSYGVTYDFEETGKLVSGVWHEHYVDGQLAGIMYFYGPNCYKDGWQTIDGQRYYFEGIYRAEGPHMIMESNQDAFKCFVFTEDGVLTDEKYTGFVATKDFLCYVEDNIARTEGMFQLGNDLYYAHTNGKLATGVVKVSRGNGYVEDYYEYPFEANGKLYNGIYEEDGELHYYVNGTKMGRGVYYNEPGDYYVYVRSNGACATGWYEVKANDLIDAGMRLFGEDGKMFTGILEENGDLYFYRHGLRQDRGVHYVEDGDYYVYVRSTGTCAVGYYEVKASAANGLLDPQYYMFGDDGKLLRETGVMSVAGKQYYFIDGAKQGRGLYYNAEGDYYVYVKSDESVATGRYYVNATNDLLPKDYYLFGDDGRTVTGIVEEDGAYCYYEKGVKMGRGVYYNAEGDYYVYVRSTGTCATGWYEVKANDLIDPGMRLFTADGKSYTGIYEEDGKLYYYVHGLKQERGLYYNAEGDYYVYVQSNGTLATDRHYVNVTNDLLPKDYYDFGADGKLVF